MLHNGRSFRHAWNTGTLTFSQDEEWRPATSMGSFFTTMFFPLFASLSRTVKGKVRSEIRDSGGCRACVTSVLPRISGLPSQQQQRGAHWRKCVDDDYPSLPPAPPSAAPPAPRGASFQQYSLAVCCSALHREIKATTQTITQMEFNNILHYLTHGNLTLQQFTENKNEVNNFPV